MRCAGILVLVSLPPLPALILALPLLGVWLRAVRHPDYSWRLLGASVLLLLAWTGWWLAAPASRAAVLLVVFPLQLWSLVRSWMD